MRLIFWCIVYLVLACPVQLFGQGKYWVFLSEKDINLPIMAVSEKALHNRQMLGLPLIQATDIAPAQAQIEAVLATGARKGIVSKWLNAVSVWATGEQMEKITKLPGVVGSAPIAQWHTASIKSDSVEVQKYTETLRQVQGQLFKDLGLNGAGVTIGVTDAGFYEADKNMYIRHVYERGGVKATRDFVNPERKADVYQSLNSADDHGVEVMSYIAGYNPEKKGLTGLAWGADFVLARTDHQVKESRIDEDNWVASLEWLDSLGVRLINTSLGYGLGFDNPEENYKPEQMDGKQSVVAQAANIAVKNKGMIMVVAAGNDGGKSDWKIISSPADVEGVLSVGANSYTDWNKMSYSGKGPETLPYLKPDVSAASLMGTSFSAPVICGVLACILQWKPELKSDSLFKLLRRSGHLWPYPNNYLGYGVPQSGYLIKYLKTGLWHERKVEKIETKEQTVEIEIPKDWNATTLGVFHKHNEKYVMRQANITASKGKITLQRPAGAKQSTVHHAYGIWEIFWQ
jgi:hypothetical protein